MRLIIGTLTVWVFVFFPQSSMDAHVEQSKDQSVMGIDQKLGQYVPLDLTFNDETGHPVMLRQLIHKPTILALVYLPLSQCLQSSFTKSGRCPEQTAGRTGQGVHCPVDQF